MLEVVLQKLQKKNQDRFIKIRSEKNCETICGKVKSVTSSFCRTPLFRHTALYLYCAVQRHRSTRRPHNPGRISDIFISRSILSRVPYLYHISLYFSDTRLQTHREGRATSTGVSHDSCCFARNTRKQGGGNLPYMRARVRQPGPIPRAIRDHISLYRQSILHSHSRSDLKSLSQ